MRLALLLLLASIACATPGPDTLEEAEPIRIGAKIELARVSDVTASGRDIDAQALLRSALEAALTEAGLSWTGAPEQDRYALELDVVEYEPGNAFKRWLLPGYGATILRVHGRLVDVRSGVLAAGIDHQRSVAAGGGYTIGAWKSVFESVAKDVVRDLENHTHAKGFFVQLAPWASRDLEIPRAAASREYVLGPFVDRRTERGRIGERSAAFGVSMGDVHMARDVGDFLREALGDDLRAAGHRVGEEAGGTQISGEVLRFWVRTDTTPLYWDVVAQMELRLSLRPPGDASEVRNVSHACEHRERTYAWPSQALVQKTLDACLYDLLTVFRADFL